MLGIGFDDNQKVGMLMVGLGVLFLLLGTLLLFDSGLLAIGNVLFLVGLALMIGLMKCLAFFDPRRPGKLRGVVCFFGGVLLVLVRWPVVGMLIELIGIFEMFGTFLPMVVDVLRRVPYLGACLKFAPVARAVDFLSGKKAKRAPV